jgi:hypothetical protein
MRKYELSRREPYAHVWPQSGPPFTEKERDKQALARLQKEGPLAAKKPRRLEAGLRPESSALCCAKRIAPAEANARGKYAERAPLCEHVTLRFSDPTSALAGRPRGKLLSALLSWWGGRIAPIQLDQPLRRKWGTYSTHDCLGVRVRGAPPKLQSQCSLRPRTTWNAAHIPATPRRNKPTRQVQSRPRRNRPGCRPDRIEQSVSGATRPYRADKTNQRAPLRSTMSRAF